jgi:LDH2 family malate/lactate/ureidoglycolate dehydrogenase
MVFGSGYCHTTPRSTPYGGRSGALDVNPIAMGFAGPDPKAPIMFDFATTAKSGGNMHIVRRRGGSFPEGWAVDDKGDPTTDPEILFDRGYFVPFGGHKGYCMMMAAEVLGNIFSGADNYANEGPDYPMFNHQGVTMITMKADLFRPLDQFKSTLKEREERIRNVSPAAGHDEVLVPGDPERRAYAERSKSGIPIHEDDWKLIVESAASAGCKID